MTDREPTLNGDPIGERHSYLADARPGFETSMQSIRNRGGPWPCGNGHASLLCYRCSVCGRTIDDAGTHGRAEA